MTDEPIFTASKGKVFRRGVYLYEPSKLLGVFLSSAERGDKFSAELATELQDAIGAAEAYGHHIPCAHCDGNGHRCDQCDGDGFLLAEDVPVRTFESHIEWSRP